MKNIVPILLVTLAGAALAQASVVTVLEDNFDGYFDMSEVTMMWPGSSKLTTISAGLTLEEVDGDLAIKQATTVAGRLSQQISPIVATDANPIAYSFQFKDTVNANIRHYGTLQDYDPASAQLLAIGTTTASTKDLRTGLAATVTDYNTYYCARITFGTGAPNWFLLNGDGAPTRSRGWHEMKIIVKNNTVDFLIDGVSGVQGLSAATYNIASGLSWDHISVGSGLSSPNGVGYYDDVKLQILPEPVSLMLLAVGGLFLRRRRA